MQAAVDAFGKQGSAKAELNTVASETFRTQLPTYLTSGNPPDVYTWYPGSVAESYAKKDLLLDVSDLWTGPELKGYSDSLKKLCTSASGQKVFVPTTYYWWGVFYRKSNFAKWGVKEPRTWDDFMDLCDTLKSKKVAPIGLGAGGGTPWVASSWFDYLNLASTAPTTTAICSQGSTASTTPRSAGSSTAGARPSRTSTPTAPPSPSRTPPPPSSRAAPA